MIYCAWTCDQLADYQSIRGDEMVCSDHYLFELEMRDYLAKENA